MCKSFFLLCAISCAVEIKVFFYVCQRYNEVNKNLLLCQDIKRNSKESVKPKLLNEDSSHIDAKRKPKQYGL